MHIGSFISLKEKLDFVMNIRDYSYGFLCINCYIFKLLVIYRAKNIGKPYDYVETFYNNIIANDLYYHLTLNKYQLNIKSMDDVVFNNIQFLYNLYDYMYKYYSLKFSGTNDCDHANKCYALYKSRISECHSSNENAFYKAIRMFQEAYETYMFDSMCDNIPKSLKTYLIENKASILSVNPINEKSGQSDLIKIYYLDNSIHYSKSRSILSIIGLPIIAIFGIVFTFTIFIQVINSMYEKI
ncbi:Plasmodium exported protein, unknown function [Plasmodium gonderi]|uniref:Variable surface protein n=1 Tax=Plasmodium gonderi TaxID=77519 RepID=A0A1Y1JR47_PLAGO|nr:Plasmodium exported protein, unknown function [Plasmodium gonderi]GAW84720.1 Plasmodium exported protein, unknown function [Plasmodium gonderi]